MPAPSALESFEKMLASGKGGAPLRFSLGNEYQKSGRAADAAAHLRRAVEMDAGYTAAWKLLGRALADAGRPEDALAAYREGIAVAKRKGDKQAGKEMTVFARRLEKALSPK